MSIHAVWGTVRLTGRVRFRVLGLILTGQAVLFTVLIGMTL
jgi:hypothetical protein